MGEYEGPIRDFRSAFERMQSLNARLDLVNRDIMTTWKQLGQVVSVSIEARVIFENLMTGEAFSWVPVEGKKLTGDLPPVLSGSHELITAPYRTVEGIVYPIRRDGDMLSGPEVPLFDPQTLDVTNRLQPVLVLPVRFSGG